MNPEDKILRWIYLGVLAVIWGSSFILMKKGLIAFEPDQLGAIRMSVSFFSLLPLVLFRMKEVKKDRYKFIFATGILGNGIPAFLFAFAQVYIASAVAGMLNSLTPVFVVIVGYLFFRTVFKLSHIAGVIIGLAGASGLILVSKGGNLDVNNVWFALLVVLATVCYAFSVNIMRNYLHEVDAVLITGFALFAAGIPCTIYLFTTDFISRFSNVPQAWFSFGCIAALALLSTSLSTILFNRLIKISSALYASSVTYLIPLVAMLWGMLDSEPLGILHLISMTAILFGVYLINLESIRDMRTRKAKAGKQEELRS